MSDQPWTDMKVDLVRFQRNNDQVPPEYLVPYWGQQVAWHADGTHIVAADATHEGLYRRLREMGIATDEVVIDYVDDPNVVQF
jgi:hypothetical protein